MDCCDEALKRIDILYGMIEEIEKHIGRLASIVGECGGKGDVFAIYNVLVKARDELAELRRLLVGCCGGVK